MTGTNLDERDTLVHTGSKINYKMLFIGRTSLGVFLVVCE